MLTSCVFTTLLAQDCVLCQIIVNDLSILHLSMCIPADAELRPVPFPNFPPPKFLNILPKTLSSTLFAKYDKQINGSNTEKRVSGINRKLAE